MKKIISIRALLIALMLVLTFAIPALVSAQNLAAPVDVAEADPIVVPAEISTIDTSETTPGATVLPEEITSLKDDIVSAVKEVIDETSETETEETPTPAVTACSYCGSSGHSDGLCAQRSIDYGATGRWVVPCAGINVACYYFNPWVGTDECAAETVRLQSITDSWDSAALIDDTTQYFIADHSNQEFSCLKYVSVGMEAYMDYGTYQQKYVCTSYEYGHNTGATLTDTNGNEVYTNYDSSNYNPGGITCYTCNGNWQNIILVNFQPVYD